MASKKQVSILLLPLFFTVSFVVNSSQADDCASIGGSISVYWGQVTEEGTLQEACDTNNYNIVILESLYVYDNGSTPTLNLANHCGDAGNPCTGLEPEIIHCQSKGIKVLLSIEGDIPAAATSSHRKSIVSSDQNVADEVAGYLWDYFLSGNSGPLGSVALDGIDFGDVKQGENLQWDELVVAINASTKERKIYLSASPQCVYPDAFLDKAIKTNLFDYIWVEFYHNPTCEYSDGNSSKLFTAWDKWTSSVLANNSVFLGIPASKDAASSGYIPPDVLKSEILPTIKQASNFGGVMVWDRYHDKQTNYSGQIKDSLSKDCRCICDEAVSGRFYGMLSQFL